MWSRRPRLLKNSRGRLFHIKLSSQSSLILILVPKLRLGTPLFAKLCFANEINMLVNKPKLSN